MQHKAQYGLRAERDGIIKELSGVTSSAQGRPSLTPTHLRGTSPHSEGWSGQVHIHTSKPTFLVIDDSGGLLEERKFASDATGITEDVGSHWGTFFCLSQIQATSFRLICAQTFLETEMLWPLRPAAGAPTNRQTTLKTSGSQVQ